MKKSISIIAILTMLSFTAFSQNQPAQDAPAAAQAQPQGSGTSTSEGSSAAAPAQSSAATTPQAQPQAAQSQPAAQPQNPSETPGAVEGIANIGGKYYASSKFQFELSATDPGGVGVAKILYRIDGGEFGEFKNAFKIFNEGEHRIEYKSIDNLGNEEITKSVIIVIDNTAPASYMSFAKSGFQRGNLIYVNSENKFSISATDNLSGVKEIKYKINSGAWQTFAQGGSLPFSQQGMQTIAYKAIDNVGNEGRENTIQVFVDTIAPVVKIMPSNQTRDQSGTQMAGVNYTYKIEASDEQSGVRYIKVKVDNGQWVTYKNQIVFSTPGSHTIVTQAWDYAGNVSTPVTLTISVDALPPTTNLRASNTSSADTPAQQPQTQPAPQAQPAPSATPEAGTQTQPQSGGSAPSTTESAPSAQPAPQAGSGQ
jgi:hypothetical protein